MVCFEESPPFNIQLTKCSHSSKNFDSVLVEQEKSNLEKKVDIKAFMDKEPTNDHLFTSPLEEHFEPIKGKSPIVKRKVLDNFKKQVSELLNLSPEGYEFGSKGTAEKAQLAVQQMMKNIRTLENKNEHLEERILILTQKLETKDLELRERINFHNEEIIMHKTEAEKNKQELRLSKQYLMNIHANKGETEKDFNDYANILQDKQQKLMEASSYLADENLYLKSFVKEKVDMIGGLSESKNPEEVEFYLNKLNGFMKDYKDILDNISDIDSFLNSSLKNYIPYSSNSSLFEKVITLANSYLNKCHMTDLIEEKIHQLPLSPSFTTFQKIEEMAQFIKSSLPFSENNKEVQENEIFGPQSSGYYTPKKNQEALSDIEERGFSSAPQKVY